MMGNSVQLSDISHQLRRYRRMFDERMEKERRIIIVAAVVIIWLILDTIWVTPSYQQLKKNLKLQTALSSQQSLIASQNAEKAQILRDQQANAVNELNEIRQRFAAQEEELLTMQSQVAPAREMRQLLEALLLKHGQLKLLAMRTLPPQQVKTSGSQEAMLFKHGLAIEVGGKFHDLLSWLQSAENMPRRLIWHSMELSPSEKNPLVLKVQVYTLSQDKDALEIPR